MKSQTFKKKSKHIQLQREADHVNPGSRPWNHEGCGSGVCKVGLVCTCIAKRTHTYTYTHMDSNIKMDAAVSDSFKFKV